MACGKEKPMAPAGKGKGKGKVPPFGKKPKK